MASLRSPLRAVPAPWLRSAVVLGCVGYLCASSADAQNSASAPSAAVQNGEPGAAPYQLEIRVDRVLVPVVVHDKQGHIVGDLKKEDFQLLDRGERRPISGF